MDFLVAHDNSTPSPNRSNQLLYLSAQNGHVAAVDRILAWRTDPSKAQRSDGSQAHALHVAAINGHDRVVDRLLLRGVPLDVSNKNGDQAIHHAAIVGVAEMVSHLIAVRADPKAPSLGGASPLSLAETQGHQAVMNVLADVGSHDEL